MSQIAPSISASGRESLISVLKGNPSGSIRNSPNLAGSDNTGKASAGPASIVDLSEEAKTRLAQLETDQQVADELQELLASVKGNKADRNTAGTDTVKSLLGPDPEQDQSSSHLMQAFRDAANEGFKRFDFEDMIEQYRISYYGEGVGTLDAAASPEDDFVQHALFQLAQKVVSLESQGKTEAAQVLRNAVADGTVRIQDPDQVEGLELSYTSTTTQNEFGRSTKFKLTESATGDVKAAIENDLALTHGFAYDGAYYFDWSGTES